MRNEELKLRQELRELVGLPRQFKENPNALDGLSGLLADVVKEPIDSVEIVRLVMADG